MAVPIKPNIGTKADFAARPSVPTNQKESSTEFNLIVESIRANYERLILNWDTDIAVNTNFPVGQYVLFSNAIYKIITAYNVGNPISWDGSKAEIIIASSPEHYKGTHATSAALIAAYPTASPGDYAVVDAGGGSPSQLWIWDSSDTTWVIASGLVPNLNTVLIAGNSAGGQQIKVVADGTDPQDVVTLSQMSAAITAAVTGLLDYRGGYDASGGAYPSSGGSGSAGAILKADVYVVTVAGTLPTGRVVTVGDWLIAKVDTPGNTEANWDVIEHNVVLATNVVAGIMKLYQTTGANTDGAISQQIVTNALNLKADSKWTISTKSGSFTMSSTELAQLQLGVSLVMEGNGTGALGIPANATVAFDVGHTFAARGFLTVDATAVTGAGGTVTGTNGTLNIPVGKTVLIEKKGTNTWVLHNGSTMVSIWNTVEAGISEESTQTEAEAQVTGANTANMSGLSQSRSNSEISMYYLIRKIFTLAWTWSIGPIISDATVSTPAMFNASKKLISNAFAVLADFITGTDAVKQVTVASIIAYRRLKPTALTVVSNVLTIDCAGAVEAVFTVATPITANFSIVWLNHTDAQYIELWVQINGTVVVAMTNGTSSNPKIVSEDADMRYVPYNLTLITTAAKYHRLGFTRQTTGVTGTMSMEVSTPITV